MWRDLAKRLSGTASTLLHATLGGRSAAAGILVYHRVTPRVGGLPEPSMNVTPAQFRRQLAGLRGRGYRFRSLPEVLRRRRVGAPLEPRTVIVTFDDGFESVYLHAGVEVDRLEAVV